MSAKDKPKTWRDVIDCKIPGMWVDRMAQYARLMGYDFMCHNQRIFDVRDNSMRHVDMDVEDLDGAPKPFGDGEWARCETCGDDGFPVTLDAGYGLSKGSFALISTQEKAANLLNALRRIHDGTDRGELKALLAEAWGASPAVGDLEALSREARLRILDQVVCLDPDMMHGAADGFGGSDYE